jgi:phosphoglycerate dehydrogenase-like enzyme
MTITPPGRHNVLVVGADRLRGAFGDVPVNWRLVSSEELGRSSAPRPDIKAAILGPGAAPLGDNMLARLPSLGVVGVAGLSLHRHGADRLLDCGIALVNASHAYAESVAEFALGLAILGRRRAFVTDLVMRGGGWGATPKSHGWRAAVVSVERTVRSIASRAGLETPLLKAWRSFVPRSGLAPVQASGPRELRGSTVGLVGWGANAAAFAQRLSAAGAMVLAWSEHASPEDIRAGGATPATLAQVLSAEIVSLHRGLTPATRHCLGAPELARLRPGALLINVARGALIEPEALLARLRRGDVFACLDTFDEEPLPRRHPLRRMSNVFLTSHIAGGSRDMHAAAVREVVAKIARHLDGGSVEAITSSRLATMT